MRLIECKCPNCASVLNVDENTDFIQCNFCGSKFYVERSINLVKKEKEERQAAEIEQFKFMQYLFSKYWEAERKIKFCPQFTYSGYYSGRCLSEKIKFPQDLTGEKVAGIFFDIVLDKMVFDPKSARIDIEVNPFSHPSNELRIIATDECVKEWETKYDSYSSEKKELIMTYLYYGEKAFEYGKALTKYIELRKLKEKYHTNTYTIRDIAIMPEDKIDEEMKKLVDIMASIKLLVKADEQTRTKRKEQENREKKVNSDVVEMLDDYLEGTKESGSKTAMLDDFLLEQEENNHSKAV